MNYFAEIERYFIQKRGRGLMLSPKDWQVMSEWKEGEIPLRVVLRGIDNAFNQKGSLKQEINFLAYCKKQVDECWQEHKKQTLGATESASGKPAFHKDIILQHLSGLHNELQTRLKQAGPQLKLWQQTQNSLNNLISLVQKDDPSALDRLESQLDAIRQQLLEGLRNDMPQEKLKQIETAAEAELHGYRRWMQPEAYQATYRELVDEQVLKWYGLSELRLYGL